MHICILHFNLLEKYPPAMNFLRYLSGTGWKVTVISTDGGKEVEPFAQKGIRIERVAAWNSGASRWQRLAFYIRYHRRALALLRRLKPDAVLYYETFSAAAPCIYKKWIRPSVPLFIHYHEYMSPPEIEGGIYMIRWQHRLEKKIYPIAALVSQTNEERMARFSADIGGLQPDQKAIVPNYPPSGWTIIARQIKRPLNTRVGFVYVGALSFETMYAREMMEFVCRFPDLCYWDIYSTNYAEEVIKYLGELGATNIHFKGGVPYDHLPEILGQYDAGLILYKGTIPNFVYNAPNKFFEYYVCGLNVWYSFNMKGMHQFASSDSPAVIAKDFQLLDSSDLENIKRSEQVPGTEFVAERVYGNWLEQMKHKMSFPTPTQKG